MNSKIGYKGAVILKEYRKNENGKEYLHLTKFMKNTVTTAGITAMLERLANIGEGNDIQKIGVGDGQTAEALTDVTFAGQNHNTVQIFQRDRFVDAGILYLSVDIGYTVANYDWNEILLLSETEVAIARIVPDVPYQKTDLKRTVLEWQITLSESA